MRANGRKMNRCVPPVTRPALALLFRAMLCRALLLPAMPSSALCFPFLQCPLSRPLPRASPDRTLIETLTSTLTQAYVSETETQFKLIRTSPKPNRTLTSASPKLEP